MLTILHGVWKVFAAIIYMTLAIFFPYGWIILTIVLLSYFFSKIAKSSYEEEEYSNLKFRPLPQSRPNLYVVRRPN